MNNLMEIKNMTPLEEYLIKYEYDYTFLNDGTLKVNTGLSLINAKNIVFPDKVIIDGSLDLYSSENIILSQYLEVIWDLDLDDIKNITLPNELIVGENIYLRNSLIHDMNFNKIELGRYLKVLESFDFDTLSPYLKDKVFVTIYYKLCKWSIFFTKNLFYIGCKSKTIEEWEIFFQSNEFYETLPDTKNYQKIKEAFEYSKNLYNKIYGKDSK